MSGDKSALAELRIRYVQHMPLGHVDTLTCNVSWRQHINLRKRPNVRHT